MATIATCPGQTASDSARLGILLSPPGYAQGPEGQILGKDLALAAEGWRGPSEYVATLFAGRNDSSGPMWTLVAAGLLAVVCGGVVFADVALNMSGASLPLAGAAGLASYGFLVRWVARQHNPSGALKIAERIRRAIAYEGNM
jgi:hypothetical protein